MTFISACMALTVRADFFILRETFFGLAAF